jgi:hypothetical protein
VFGIDIGYPGRMYAEVDTGAVSLTVTADGSIGLDLEDGRRGRGFRYPKFDTSCLNVASFCLVGCGEYIADRYYSQSGSYDADWCIAESVFSRVPVWNAHELLTSAFTDAGHPRRHSVTIFQRALGVDEANWVVLVYDLLNEGLEQINGYAGILADFDVKVSDRFHDLAYTDAGIGTAYMRNIGSGSRFCGVKLLTPVTTTHLECIDHGRYVNPDSGLSENMKYRIMTGQLGASSSDRPYNWSVAIATGPLSLPHNGRQRVAFGLVAAADSAAYLDACRACQEWYDANVGVEENRASASTRPQNIASVARSTLFLPVAHVVHSSYTLFDVTGQRVAELKPGANSVSYLPAGIYLLRLASSDSDAVYRVTFVR